MGLYSDYDASADEFKTLEDGRYKLQFIEVKTSPAKNNGVMHKYVFKEVNSDLECGAFLFRSLRPTSDNYLLTRAMAGNRWRDGDKNDPTWVKYVESLVESFTFQYFFADVAVVESPSKKDPNKFFKNYNIINFTNVEPCISGDGTVLVSPGEYDYEQDAPPF